MVVRESRTQVEIPFRNTRQPIFNTMKEPSEYELMQARVQRSGKREYSLGHQRMYAGPIGLLSHGERPLRVLDIGSGVGLGWELMLNGELNIGKYVGIEPAKDSATYHQEQIKARGLSATHTVYNQSFDKWVNDDEPENLFDVIFCIEVLEHLESVEVCEAFVDKIECLLSYEGLLAISTPTPEKSPHGKWCEAQVLDFAFMACLPRPIIIREHWTTLYLFKHDKLTLG